MRPFFHPAHPNWLAPQSRRHTTWERERVHTSGGHGLQLQGFEGGNKLALWEARKGEWGSKTAEGGKARVSGMAHSPGSKGRVRDASHDPGDRG